jgi:hypothetical protein
MDVEQEIVKLRAQLKALTLIVAALVRSPGNARAIDRLTEGNIADLQALIDTLTQVADDAARGLIDPSVEAEARGSAIRHTETLRMIEEISSILVAKPNKPI